MKKKTLVLKFTNSDKEFMFEDKVFVIEDNKLVNDLSKPSIKNSDSKLVIKSLNNTHISDVLQFKINMSETGYFLVSFEKSSLSDEKKEALLKDIGKLKSNAVQTNSTQLKKTKLLVEILNKYKPLYAVFVDDGEYKVNSTKLSLEEYKFPLLILKKPEKQVEEKPEVEESKTNQKKTEQYKKNFKAKKKYTPIAPFSVDYVFVLLFAALCSFGIITALFEYKNGENIWIFLGILAFAFAIVLILSVQSTLYKKGKLINPSLRYYLILFVVIGVVGGIAGGYYVSKLVLKTEIEGFDFKNLIIISSVIAAPVCLSSLTTSRLANLIAKRKYD